MSPKRGDDVTPPTIGDEWQVKYSKTDAAKGWQELCNAAAGNAHEAWWLMRTQPGEQPNARHHRLKGGLAVGSQQGRTLPRWQIEVTGGGRIWYLLDEERHIVWLEYAGPGHPKVTG